MAAHAEWFDTQFVTIVEPGWEAGDGTVDDHAIVVGFDNYAVIEGSLDDLDKFADRIKLGVAAHQAGEHVREGGGDFCNTCGEPFSIDDNGIATHDSDTEPTGIDHDADEDHVPFSEGDRNV